MQWGQQSKPNPLFPNPPLFSKIRELVTKMTNFRLPLDRRLDILQPLMAAAGLAAPVPGSALHSGAVLFALTDQECAQTVRAPVLPQ